MFLNVVLVYFIVHLFVRVSACVTWTACFSAHKHTILLYVLLHCCFIHSASDLMYIIGRDGQQRERERGGSERERERWRERDREREREGEIERDMHRIYTAVIKKVTEGN